MALIQCKECGSQVSDKATVCPQCGNPLNNSLSGKKSLWFILGILAIAAIIGSCILFFDGRNGFPGTVSDIVNITPEFSKKIRNYKQVSNFSEGYAAVMRDGKWGYIDMNGEEVISCRYDYAYPFIEGIARVIINDKDRYINIKAEEVKDGVYRYNKKTVVESDSPYILFKSEDEKYGYKDEKGIIIIPAKYNTLESFHNGVTLAIIHTNEYDPSHQEDVWIYGYVDMKGNSTFTENDFVKIEQSNERARASAQIESERLKKEIEARRLEQESLASLDWLNGVWSAPYVYNGRKYIYRAQISGNTITVAIDNMIDYQGAYTIQSLSNGQKYLVYDNGKDMFGLDIVNHRLMLDDVTYMTHQDAQNSNVYSSSTINQGHISGRDYEDTYFTSDASVWGFLSGKTFSSNGYNVRISQNGVIVNGNLGTNAPRIKTLTRTYAILEAQLALEPTMVSIYIYPQQNRITMEGQSYYAR